jgi:hypothetical protein
VHQEETDLYPEDVKQDFSRLSDWLFQIAHLYGDQIQIKLIDPQSFVGFFKIIALLDTKVDHIHRRRLGEAHWMG